MASNAMSSRSGVLDTLAPSHLGVVGQVAMSWGVAGGLLASVVVTAHVFLGQLSSSLGFLTTTLFFLAGSLIGYFHGAILGYLGRPEDVSRTRALRRLALAMFYAVPTMIAGWLVAMVLAMSAASFLAGRTVALLVSLLGWLATAGVLVWAGIETRAAIGSLCRRWPGARALLVALALAFVALLPVFIVSRPTVWVVGVEPTATTAGAMAAVATIWIVGPVGVLLLLAVRAWSRRDSRPSELEVPHAAE